MSKLIIKKFNIGDMVRVKIPKIRRYRYTEDLFNFLQGKSGEIVKVYFSLIEQKNIFHVRFSESLKTWGSCDIEGTNIWGVPAEDFRVIK